MPFSDALLNLVPFGSSLSLVGVASARSAVLDFLGQGQGTAPQNIIGSTTIFGQPDAFGEALYRLELELATSAADFVGAGVSLQVALQYANDLGAPSYLPDTWVTAIQSGTIVVGTLLKNTQFFRTNMVLPPAGLTRPRYFSLNFTMSGGMFTTGSIAYSLLTPGRDDLVNRYAAKNFTV